MLRFFFSLIIILLSSCVADQLQMHRNAKKQPIAENHIQMLPRGYKIEGGALSGDLDYKHLLECLQSEFCLNDSSLGKITIPSSLTSPSGQSFAMTPLTTANDYPKDEQESFVDTGVGLVLLNCYASMGFTSLLDYADNKEKMSNMSHNVVAKIQEIILNAKQALKAGTPIGYVWCKGLEQINEYKTKQLLQSCKYGYLQDNKEIQERFDGQFVKASKDAQASLLKAIRTDFSIKKALYTMYPDDALLLTYVHCYYEKRFTDLHILAKVFDVHQERGERDAAQFYLEAIKILAKTAAQPDENVQKEINEAFEVAKQAPLKTSDEWLADLQKKEKNDRAKTRRKQTNVISTQKAKIKKVNKHKLPNLSSKDTGKAGHSTSLLPSTLEQSQEELQEKNTVVQCIPGLKNSFKDFGYSFAHSVFRWEDVTPEEIRNFDLKKEKNYANLSNKEIMRQKAFHHLKPAALLLCVDDHEDYLFKVDCKSNPQLNFKKAFASLEINGAVYEGMLEIIISDKNQIYHLMFNDKVKHKPEQLFQIISSKEKYLFDDAEEDNQTSSQWCNKDGFEIAKQRDRYVIKLDMPTSTDAIHHSCRKLVVYPNKLSIKSIERN